MDASSPDTMTEKSQVTISHNIPCRGPWSLLALPLCSLRQVALPPCITHSGQRPELWNIPITSTHAACWQAGLLWLWNLSPACCAPAAGCKCHSGTCEPDWAQHYALQRCTCARSELAPKRMWLIAKREGHVTCKFCMQRCVPCIQPCHAHAAFDLTRYRNTRRTHLRHRCCSSTPNSAQV